MLENKVNSEVPKSPHFLVVGTGPLGEKAQQLQDKTSALEALGFHVPHRTVLTADFFDDFFKKNSFGANLNDSAVRGVTEEEIRMGTFTPEQMDVLMDVCGRYGASPLVVRSSDNARGTGAYKSTFTNNNKRSIPESIREVLGSYFSLDAVMLRRDMTGDSEFGVMIEPLIGQRNSNFIAPILSGMGYTSTSSGKGYVTMVPGLSCGVDTRGGLRVDKNKLDEYGSTLGAYIYELSQGPLSNTALLMPHHEDYVRGSYRGKVFLPSNLHSRGRIDDNFIHYPAKIQSVLENLNLSSLFLKMEQMEQRFGKPQYLEWAMTIEKGQPVFWVVQIADVNKNKKVDKIEFGDLGTIMFTGHTVTGTGVVEAKKIFYCKNLNDLYKLEDFNGKNREGYVLFYADYLVSGGNDLPYRYFSNASVLIEMHRGKHTSGSSLEHIMGQIALTDKLFAILHNDKALKPLPAWKVPLDEDSHEVGQVYEGRVTITASEQKQILIISTKDVDIAA